MQVLEMILKSHEIDFNAKDRRIMCFAHVINICSGRVIHTVSHGVADEDDASSSTSDDDIVASDPIELAHAVVRVIRGSGTRRDAFDKIIKDGNKEGWFEAGELLEVVQLKPLQLLQDVRTRWDLVHHMLRRLCVMRPVCPYLTRCNAR